MCICIYISSNTPSACKEPALASSCLRRFVTSYMFIHIDALWDCVPRVCGGGGGCAGGGVPLGAMPVMSWRGEVSLGGKQSSLREGGPDTSL